MPKHDTQNLHDRLCLLIKGAPDDTERDTREKLWSEIKSNEARIRELFDSWFDNNYSRLDVSRDDHTISIQRKGRWKSTTRVQVVKRAAAGALDDFLGTIKVMTFGECAKAGGAFTRISKLGKSSEVVGKKLTDQHIRNVWFRNS